MSEWDEQAKRLHAATHGAEVSDPEQAMAARRQKNDDDDESFVVHKKGLGIPLPEQFRYHGEA